MDTEATQTNEVAAQSTEEASGMDALVNEIVGKDEAKADLPDENSESEEGQKEPSTDKEDSPFLRSENDKEDGEEADKKADAAPEAYEYTPPEWVKENFDQKGYDEFQSFAKENGIPQEVFGSLLDKYFENMQKLTQDFAAEQTRQKVEQQTRWNKELRSDPDIGGKNFDKNVGYAKRAIDAFGGSKLSNALKEAGVGSHPVIVKAFIEIGKTFGEAEFVGGERKPAKQQKSLVDIFYS